MSTDGVAEIVHYDEGVVATRSGAAFFVKLPESTSASHQLCIIAVLWRTWLETKDEDSAEDVEWNIIVSALDKLTLPLITIMASIDTELKRSGRKLVVLDERSTPSRVRVHADA